MWASRRKIQAEQRRITLPGHKSDHQPTTAQDMLTNNTTADSQWVNCAPWLVLAMHFSPYKVVLALSLLILVNCWPCAAKLQNSLGNRPRARKKALRTEPRKRRQHCPAGITAAAKTAFQQGKPAKTKVQRQEGRHQGKNQGNKGTQPKPRKHSQPQPQPSNHMLQPGSCAQQHPPHSAPPPRLSRRMQQRPFMFNTATTFCRPPGVSNFHSCSAKHVNSNWHAPHTATTSTVRGFHSLVG